MNSSRQIGFTLLEMMMAIAVAGIILGIGVPSLLTSVRTNKSVTEVNRLVNALTLARSEAAGRGLSVQVLPSSGGDWATGWYVGADIDKDGVFPEDNEVFREFEPITTATFTSSPDSVVFHATGGVDEAVVFNILPNDCDNKNNRPRVVSVGPAGFVDLVHRNCP